MINQESGKDSCPEEHRDELILRVPIWSGQPQVPALLERISPISPRKP